MEGHRALNVDSETKVNVEDIKPEIRAGGEAVTETFAIDHLLLIMEIESEHSE